MGKTITQHAIGNAIYPSQSLAQMVRHILSNGGTYSTLLCAYFAKGKWHTAKSKAVFDIARTTAKAMGLDKTGIDPDLIGAHSLHADGAMALNMHGYVDTPIMKMER